MLWLWMAAIVSTLYSSAMPLSVRIIRHASIACFCLLLSACNHIEKKQAVPRTKASASVAHLNSLMEERGAEARFKDGYVTANGSRLHYVIAGEGKPLVFYHGFPGYWYIWKHQLMDLAADYQVIAFDGLGANLSDKPDSLNAYSVENLATQLGEAIKQVISEPYALIGHDWGGALVWAFAQQQPPGLEELIVLSAPPYNQFLELLRTNENQRAASAYVERLKPAAAELRLGADNALGFWRIGGYEKMTKLGIISPTEGQLFKDALARKGALRGGLNWYRANIPEPQHISDNDFWPSQSAMVETKSLLIWGDKDRTFVADFIEGLAQYAKSPKVEILPGVGHAPQVEEPDKVSKLIREFIQDRD